MIYFCQAGNDGPIKIGFAAKPKRRVLNLQVGNHVELDLVLTIDGDESREREMHREFAGDRIRGEWFRPSAALVAFINRHRRVARRAQAASRLDAAEPNIEPCGWCRTQDPECEVCDGTGWMPAGHLL